MRNRKKFATLAFWPFGKQFFKMARLSFMPFGASVIG
nr:MULTISPECIES: YccF domain-containing protein [Lachnospiraceae]